MSEVSRPPRRATPCASTAHTRHVGACSETYPHPADARTTTRHASRCDEAGSPSAAAAHAKPCARALDRWGLRCTAYLLIALGAGGVLTAVTGHSLISLALGLIVVGMTSGAADVASNSVAGRAEQLSGRPIITRAGAVFSVAVVVSSLGTGAAYALDAPTWLPFAFVLLLSVAAGVAVHLRLPAVSPSLVNSSSPRTALRPLLLLGALGASAALSLPVLKRSRLRVATA